MPSQHESERERHERLASKQCGPGETYVGTLRRAHIGDYADTYDIEVRLPNGRIVKRQITDDESF